LKASGRLCAYIAAILIAASMLPGCGKQQDSTPPKPPAPKPPQTTPDSPLAKYEPGVGTYGGRLVTGVISNPKSFL